MESPVTAVATADRLSSSDRAALDDLADRLAGTYDVGFGEGAYWAFRLIGGPLLEAGTLRALEAAIGADMRGPGR